MSLGLSSTVAVGLANPAGLWLLAMAAPIIALHVLRPRRARHEVRSVLLWRQVASPVSSATPWQRLVPSTLLILQLLAVLLLALAVARPVQAQETPLAPHTVFIVDASASMAAREGTERRIDLALERADDLFGEVPDGGVASVVEAGVTARVALSASDDRRAFDGALAAIEVSEGSADFAGAFALARSLETPGVPIGFVLLSDGGLDVAAARTIPTGTRYEAVGSETTNRAIAGLSVEPRGSALHVVATVVHTGGPAATQTIRIDVDGVTEHTARVELADGATVEVAADVPAGERIEAFLEGEDALDIDDHRYATAPPVEDLSVAVLGPPDAFLDILLSSLPGVTATAVDSAAAAPDADVLVVNQVPVPAEVSAGVWAIAPTGGIADVTVTGEQERPAVALVDTRDPLLADLDLTELAVAVSQQVEAPLAAELIGAEATPLLLRGEQQGHEFVYQTFSIGDSNLPIQVAFPILGDRILRTLAGPGAVGVTLDVGDRLPADVSQTVMLTRPGGAIVERPPGSGAPVADRAGFWHVQVGDGDPVLVAVNPTTSESDLSVAQALPIEEPTRARGEALDLAQTETSVLAWVAIPLLLLLLAEAVMSHRRLGVSRRQWRVALAGRLVLAAMVLLALADVAITRPSNRVATVFVLDASDSLGDGGRVAALEWIEEAVAGQPDDALAGLAVFGGDAQLESTVRSSLSVSRPAVQIDPTRTDLAGALRLAAAVLPTDARRRVVLVSDGRATQGDVTREAERLATDGIVVEFHAVGRSGGRDVAVSDLELPGRVREGEVVTVTATVDATDAGPARVDLLRDGIQVSTQTLDLVPGPNRVTFTDVAEGSGVVRYQVRVRSSGDTIADNDLAFGAAQIDGPARVLLVEGRAGNASTLAAALTAAAVDVEVVGADSIPPVDELAGIASTVLIDVDARALAPEHLDALVAATRDLGRGLVTIGGTQSYGLGGYRGSELEALLPVESEILDPKRRQTVAEVLAIDTSGSMGACHCAEGNNGVVDGNSMQGGVNKTDISRAGAARAIESLADIDEVGVLAVDTRERWLIDLQQVPAEDVVTSGLRKLVPSGDSTDLSRSLKVSADALRESSAALKHVILFTDGFTEPQQLAGLEDDAAELLAEGITVSVVATGEGASVELQAVADAGGGRFYPGRDLQEVPDIIADEAVLASRDFVQEGRFVPELTSNADPVASLTSSPPILGYVATTARPLATTHLRLGPEADPLLASWQVGLGRATSWTSDLDRWGQLWASWDGFVDFWAGVVKDTYPTNEEAGAIRAAVDGDVLRIEVESLDDFPDGSSGTARVVRPDGEVDEVVLTRGPGNRFSGEVEVTGAGSYAVGATVRSGDRVSVAGSTLATRSYGAEYVPGEIDIDLLDAVSARTAGRGAIEPSAAFDAADLDAGRRRHSLAPWLLLAAALLWPVLVALSRLSLRAAGVTTTARTASATLGRRLRASVPRVGDGLPPAARPDGQPGSGPPTTGAGGSTVPGSPMPDDTSEEPAAEAPPKSTLGSLLESQRARRDRPDDD